MVIFLQTYPTPRSVTDFDKCDYDDRCGTELHSACQSIDYMFERQEVSQRPFTTFIGHALDDIPANGATVTINKIGQILESDAANDDCVNINLDGGTIIIDAHYVIFKRLEINFGKPGTT
jgi:hypothetical protein